jgi:hypothetical protein
MTTKLGRPFNKTWLHATPFWIAAYGSNSPGLLGWDVSRTTPQGAQLTCPILAWQYAGNLGSDQSLDCNLSNPSESGLMERLIAPP